MKILVVDDSKLARLSILKALEVVDLSYESFEADDGLKAMEVFEAEKPQIVFLDLTMPLKNGYEVLKEIMSIEPSTKVIVVSADVQTQAKEKVLADGAKTFCPKPITEEKMLEIFSNLEV